MLMLVFHSILPHKNSNTSMKDWNNKGKKLVDERVEFYPKRYDNRKGLSKFSIKKKDIATSTYAIDLETGDLLKNRYNNNQLETLQYFANEYKDEIEKYAGKDLYENFKKVIK